MTAEQAMLDTTIATVAVLFFSASSSWLITRLIFNFGDCDNRARWFFVVLTGVLVGSVLLAALGAQQ